MNLRSTSIAELPTKAKDKADILSSRELFEAKWLVPHGAVQWVIAEGFRMGMHHVYVSPEIAAYLLDHYNYDSQRRLRSHSLDYYVGEMKANRWLPTTSLMFYRDEGVWRFVDGQHRLWAIINSGVGQHFWLQLAENDAVKIGTVYSVMDTGAMRTMPDITRPLFSVDVPGIREGSVYAAVRYIRSGMIDSQRVSPAIMAADAKKWEPFFIAYADAVRGGPNYSYLRAATFVALGGITMRYQPERAYEFWHSLSYMSGFTEGDPRARLVREITEEKSEIRQTTGRKNLYAVSRTVSWIWKKWLAGETLKNLVVPRSNHIKIDGTPYDNSLPNNGM